MSAGPVPIERKLNINDVSNMEPKNILPTVDINSNLLNPFKNIYHINFIQFNVFVEYLNGVLQREHKIFDYILFIAISHYDF